MNFHFPARTATCAAAHDGSALSVTLCLFATRSLFPAPPEMPPGFAWPVFRPARLTVPRLTTAPRFLSRSACSRRGHYSPLRRKCRRASPGLFSGLRGSLCRGSRRLRAFCHALPVRDAVTIPRSAGNAAGLRLACFPACAAHCAAAHDGSALPVTLRALRDGQLLVPPQKTPCACGATAFSPAGLAVSLLPGAPRFCVGAALVAARGRVWAPAPTSLQFLPSHMAAAPLAPTPHATQGADIHSIHRA